MGKIAIVFSGQGAQYPGMGKALYDCSPAAKALYDYAESVRPGTMAMSFEGPAEALTRTENTQPCLYLVDLCAALALKEQGIEARAVAGFSLGEIAALAYAGVYTPEAGFEIVSRRGQLMQAAAEVHDTAMTAVLKLDSAAVEALCQGVAEAYPVNYNSPAQTVVAGSKAALAELKEQVKAEGGRTVDLAVSAAFHSPFMDEAASAFADYLSGCELQKPQMPVYANYSGLPYGENVLDTLSRQMNHPVLWCKTVQQMIADGYTDFIEAGAGKTLSGLIKKISADVNVYAVEDAESLHAAVEAVKANA